MKKLWVLPYNGGSRSAKDLAKALACKRIKTKGKSKFKPRPTSLVINWGCSNLPVNTGPATVFNAPANVALAANKLKTFQQIAEHCRVVPWTQDPEVAKEWATKGKTVVARTILSGHSGAGIVLYEGEGEFPKAPLYTCYVPKDAEYRVHSFASGAAFVQRKARKAEVAEPNWKIRNLAGGFIYANDPENVGDIPPDVLEQAHAARAWLGLDFAAVDVLYNKKQNKAYVIEANCAPGLTGRTLEFYTEAFKYLKG